jgi:hypothetical protein
MRKGASSRHKAQLIEKGYMQKQGIASEEASAPVARIESIKLILVVAAHEG